ncbi:NrsF family protein [Ramlibacter sp. WS9]|uniref:NrsF family protein n=1 Tax=Ramlibacter sp. WS9 TaxID=1882741 RepID=UPI00114324CF|nr:DUF1109 domain-containing protein [Ramlibacter sp. WS9]ROZ78248.1 DUF1109 domain-containing protein [Ramlibacter sp. WS9]
MKTDDLVAMLATGVTAVPRRAAHRRIGLALLAGVPLSLAILFTGYGLRDDLGQVISLPMFWAKLLFPLCIAVSAFVTVERLARPGVEVRRAWMGLVAPVLVVWAMAVAAWFTAPMEDRIPALLGQSWRTCALSIGLMALPVFVTALLALRGLAPTRPALAGAAAGALAGGVGAAIYALYCIELAAPFLAVWYVIGMMVPVLAGAMLGRWLLRW